MTPTTRQTGLRGEQIAADYLRAQGYTVLAANWHCAEGELDIVAQRNGEIVFVEVKTRTSQTTETAFLSVSPRKQAKFVAAAYAFLAAHGLDDARWRLDVIAIALSRSGAPVIEHAENALDW